MATVTHRRAGEQSGGNARRSVLVLGEPGVGKTRFAGTFPFPLFLDYEQGCSSATPNGRPLTLEVATEKSTLTTTRKIVAAIKAGSFDPETGLVTFTYDGHKMSCATLVIDTIDVIQLACKQFDILKNKVKMEMQDWDIILNKMSPLMMDLNALPVHVVVTAHTKKREPFKDRSGTHHAGEAAIAMQGSIRNQLPGWFDLILHVVTVDSRGNRAIVTGPKSLGGYKLLAKDRHGLLDHMLNDKGFIPQPLGENGYPVPDIANTICGKL